MSNGFLAVTYGPRFLFTPAEFERLFTVVTCDYKDGVSQAQD